EPEITVKPGSRRFEARVRELADPSALDAAADLFVREIVPFDYVDYAGYHWGFPTRRKIEEAHRRWAAEGVMVAIDIEVGMTEK
ncbi:MAG: hypothetical protein IIA23_11060, partial [Chloroflexi bacterium]|nr:hypothetical protein [Chloroflexota bacterium]